MQADHDAAHDAADDVGAQSASLTVREPTDSAALPASPQEPFHGTRGDAPGPGGCWAVKKDGQPCRAAVLTAEGADFCSAHSGLGIASDPSAHWPRGVKASAESRRRKAELRLVLRSTRLASPRSALKALANVNAERLAGRAITAALDPDTEPLKAADLALRIINEADPRDQAVLSVEGSIDPSTASLSQLLSFAEHHQISLDGPGDGLIEPSHA